MGCVGCFNEFGGPWDIIVDLDDVEIDGDRLLFRRRNRLNRRVPADTLWFSTTQQPKGAVLFTNRLSKLWKQECFTYR